MPQPQNSALPHPVGVLVSWSQMQGLHSLALSLSRLLLDAQAGVCMITPELECSGKGQMGRSPTCVCCQMMTKPPSSPPGLVTVESCLSDMNCNPKVITWSREGCRWFAPSPLITSPGGVEIGRARSQRQIFPAPAKARGQTWENQRSLPQFLSREVMD